MEHDFFYGSQSESFSFCRIPRQLLTGAAYREISTDAKLLYGLLLDRMGLSAKNGWYDDFNRVYIYYSMALRYSNSPRSSAFSHADASRSSNSNGTGSTAPPRQINRHIGGCSPPPIPGSTSALQRGTELRAANEPSAKAESPAAAEQALPERSKPVASYSSCQAPFKTFFY